MGWLNSTSIAIANEKISPLVLEKIYVYYQYSPVFDFQVEYVPFILISKIIVNAVRYRYYDARDKIISLDMLIFSHHIYT